MKKHLIYLWGTGKWGSMAFDSLRKDKCVLGGVIDNDIKKQGTLWKEDIIIESPDILKKGDYDYILIAVKKYETVLEICKELGIEDNKILLVEEENEEVDFWEYRIFKIERLEDELALYKAQLENIPYESEKLPVPIIRPADELLKKIITEQKSLCRFGDGEFELMRGKERPWFQSMNIKLQERLKEVFYNEIPDMYYAVANNFGDLSKFNVKAANAIRHYMSGGTRGALMKIVGTTRIYYDAYVSRPYILYKNGDNAKVIFGLFKEVWNGRDILIVEGEYTRNGVGNDLFAGAKSIKRILCPSKNAFDKYDEILKNVIKHSVSSTLILITLGPTATVLAYDLAKCGRQVIDIGQLDNEYEWYLRDAKDRIAIPGKAVAELSGYHSAPAVEAVDYKEQIVAKIY